MVAVPIAAKLSKGSTIVSGTISSRNWWDLLNQVDATYRSELRELSEINWARFEAKLDQRIAELRADVRADLHELKAEMIKWMFLFWAGTAFAGLLLRAVGWAAP